jgi:hypothetical protein
MSLDAVAVQLARLGLYNSGPVGPTNPYGLAADGHQSNFPQACSDLAAVASAIAPWMAAVDANGQLLPPGGAFRNVILNGCADVAQRGNGPFATAVAKTFDGETTALGTTTSRVQFGGDVTDCPWAVTGTWPLLAAPQWIRIHEIEHAFTLDAGPVVYSTWVRSAAAATLWVIVEQNFGAGGSTAVQAYARAGAAIPTGPTWQRVSFTFDLPSTLGKTFGAGHRLRVYVGPGASAPAGQMWLAGAQLERGETASPLERRPPWLETLFARRYLQSTYPDGVAPGTLNAGGALGALSNASGAFFEWRFPTPMRVAPTVQTFRPDGAGSGTTASPGSAAVSLVRSTPDVVSLLATTGTTAGNVCSVHVLADASL